jgi:hypothetical protein
MCTSACPVRPWNSFCAASTVGDIAATGFSCALHFGEN